MSTLEELRVADREMYERYAQAIKIADKLKRAWYATGKAYDDAVAAEARKGDAE